MKNLIFILIIKWGMDDGNCKPYLISIKKLIFILLCAFYSCTRFKFVLFAAVVAERAARFFLSAIFDFRSKGAPRGSFSCSEVFGRQTDLACFLTEYRVRRPVDLLARSPFFVSASVLRFPLGLWLRAQYFRSRFFFCSRAVGKIWFSVRRFASRSLRQVLSSTQRRQSFSPARFPAWPRRVLPPWFWQQEPVLRSQQLPPDFFLRPRALVSRNRISAPPEIASVRDSQIWFRAGATLLIFFDSRPWVLRARHSQVLLQLPPKIFLSASFLVLLQELDPRAQGTLTCFPPTAYHPKLSYKPASQIYDNFL
jgi:hypothetical protein